MSAADYWYYYHEASDCVFKNFTRIDIVYLIRDDVREITLEEYIDMSIARNDNHEDTLI